MKKTLFFSFGPIFSAFIGFITIPILSWVFTPEVLGKLSIFNVLIGFSTLFFTLGIDFYFIRNSTKNDVVNNYFGIITLPLLFTVIFISMSSFWSDELSRLFFYEKGERLFYLVSICLFLSVLGRFLSLKARLDERPLIYSFYLVFLKVNILFFLSLFCFFSMEKSFYNLLVIYLSSIFTSVLYLIAFLKPKGSFWVPSVSETKKYINFGFPMMLGGVAYWGINSVDRFFIESFLGMSELGVYSVAFSISSIMVVFQSIFSLVWVADIYKYSDQRDVVLNKIRTAYDSLIILTSLLFLTFSLLLPFLLSYLPPEYYEAKKLMPVIFLCPVFFIFAEVAVVGVGIKNNTKVIMYITVFCFSLNVVLNYFLLAAFGLLGASVSTLITFLVMFILRCECSCKLWFSYPRLRVYIYLVFVSFLSLLLALDLIPTFFIVVTFLFSLCFTVLYFLKKYKFLLKFRVNG